MVACRSKFSEFARVVVDCSGGKERTKQSFKDQCNINHIMSRYLRSGNVDHLAKHGAHYAVVEPLTFHECMNIVRKAEEMFNDLPAKLRQRFGGEPANFLAFVQDRENLEEMRELGLARPEEKFEDAVQRVHIVSSELEDHPEPDVDGKPEAPAKGAKKPAKPARTRST